MHDKHIKRGMMPGSLVFVGEQKTVDVILRLIDYDKDSLTENTLSSVEEMSGHLLTSHVSWFNIDGLHDAELMARVKDTFNIHSLVMEDIMNTAQRPKTEEFDDYIFVVLKMLRIDKTTDQLVTEQLSIILSKNFVLTFQELKGDVFEPVRERIRKSKGRIRSSGTDYLAFALMDMVVDNYIYVVEKFGERVEDMGEEVMANPKPTLLPKLNDLKSESASLRKAIRPAREAVAHLGKIEDETISEGVEPFFRDLQDHIDHAVEAVDEYREMLDDQLNAYNSSVSNRLNDIMKVLTVFTAVFIPLSFLAGVYGTNFDNVPELHFHYGYYIFWGVSVVVVSGMIYYFKRKGWFD